MVIREKDREVSSYVAAIQKLKQENVKYKAKAVQKHNYKTLDEMMEKLTESEKKNDDLKTEISALKRI